MLTGMVLSDLINRQGNRNLLFEMEVGVRGPRLTMRKSRGAEDVILFLGCRRLSQKQ